MRKIIDLTGKKIGKWRIIERNGGDNYGHPYWLCKCDCGTLRTVDGSHLRRNKSLSCGCNVFKTEVQTNNWNRGNIMWLAGYLEGEGSFRHKKNGCSDIIAASTDLDVLDKVKEIAGCGRIYFLKGKQNKKGDNYKPQWQWTCYRKYETYALLATIYSFMGGRRKEKIKECLREFKNGR